MQDVVTLLGQTINQTRRGQLDTRVANAVGYLAGILLKGLQDADIELRIKRLEENQANRALRNDVNGQAKTNLPDGKFLRLLGQILAPFPEAKAAVGDVLEKLTAAENRQGHLNGQES
jgi:hypothetical protein